MKNIRKLLLFPLIVIFLVSFVSAHDVNIDFYDLSNNLLISNAVLDYTVDGEALSTFIGEDGRLKLALEEGEHTLKYHVNLPDTDGYDYYNEHKLTITENTLTYTYLYPIGLIRGVVKDSLDNVVPNSELKFECISHVIKEYPTMTDKYGFFKVENVPEGSCKIFATYMEGVGSVDVIITQGSVNDVTINLDKTLYVRKSVWSTAVIFGILLLFILFAYYISKQYRGLIKASKTPQITTKSPKQPSLTPKKSVLTTPKPAKIGQSEAIIKTLNEKEKQVVQYLQNNGNKASQASVRHALGIPRTTLSRLLISLEKKKIVKVEKLGKMVKINLTDFFLGKE